MTLQKKIDLARSVGRSGPDFVICRTKTENPRNHFVIPHEKLADLLLPESMSTSANKHGRWEAWIDGNELRVTNVRETIDLRPYFEAKLSVEPDDVYIPAVYPDESEFRTAITEGHATLVSVNRYERNQRARELCIKYHSPICAVCEFDFGKVYGAIAEGFIHVHHVKPISSIGERYEVDPINDLRPLCPNCHAVAHMTGGPYSIEQIKAMIAASSDTDKSSVLG